MQNKKSDLLVANILFVLHFIFMGIILFGWMFSEIYFLYIAVLLITLFCWIFLGYCPVTKWEFKIRRKYEPGLNYKNEYMEYYVSKFFKINIPVLLIRITGIIFLILSLLIAFKVYN